MEGSEADWFDGIAESVHANLPFGALGVVVNGYDVSDPEPPVFTKVHHAGVDGLADSRPSSFGRDGRFGPGPATPR